ncbi:hypothetical protein D9Q98_006203 [Chlorella vulgaris]|uniref:Phytanoyl-CoA dioxygenase n=1 Tax=Chlorella vulgaris TaxID=3077 RepID=A0A9D4TY84_CHLVU|nr:hypothetical protein D9Q98_006203 [Chlorella vulgaris]
MLSVEQLEQFKRDGFLVVEGFASLEEVAALKQRGEELVEAWDPEAISVFSTRNQTSKTDNYFLDSASDVGFFFEEKALDEGGKLVKPKNRAINKIGHALHDLDPVFRRWSRSSHVADVMQSLGFQRPVPVQSMLIFKQPYVGGEVVPHQDSSFLCTSPLSCVGIWLALEDATQTNGCMWTLPGSHLDGVHRRFVRAPDGTVSFEGDMPEFEEAAFVPLEAKAGSLVLLHGANVHTSKENNSPVSRHAYTMHFVESAPGYTYATDNWLQRRAEVPFEPLYDISGSSSTPETPPAFAQPPHRCRQAVTAQS